MDDRSTVRVLVQPRLGPWATAWDKLVEQLPVPSPFVRSWWLEATAGPQPRFVLVTDGHALLGGIALQEERWLGMPYLAVMGAGVLCPDHLDLVAAWDREDDVV